MQSGLSRCPGVLQMGRPRVQFACASALAMLVEGHPEACPLVQSHGGIIALASMLHQAGAQAKKAAAEALQVTLLLFPLSAGKLAGHVCCLILVQMLLNHCLLCNALQITSNWTYHCYCLFLLLASSSCKPVQHATAVTLFYSHMACMYLRCHIRILNSGLNR